jgi:hypothetical protein
MGVEYIEAVYGKQINSKFTVSRFDETSAPCESKW